MKEEVIQKIEQLTQEKGFIYSLAWILLINFFLDPEKAADIDWRKKLSFQEISFLVGLMLKKPFTVEEIDADTRESQISRVHEFFPELHHSIFAPVAEQIRNSFKRPDEHKTIEECIKSTFGAGEVMAEAIFYGDSGAYDFQLLDFAVKRYKQDEEWIVKNKGFRIESAVACCKALKKLHETRLTNGRRTKDLDEFSRIALSVFCFTRDDLPPLPPDEINNILKTFSVKPGDQPQHFNVPGQYNLINSHPIIALEENLFFVPVLFNLAQSIYESPFYWMLQDAKYKEASFYNRGKSTVDIAYDLLTPVFGVENIYKQVNIHKSAAKLLTDIDLLVVAGNKAIVFQIKSKKLTELSRQGNDEKLRQDFVQAIQDSYDQGVLCRDAIIAKQNLLVDESGKKVILDDRINDVYIVCVTSDHYPAVTFQTKTFLKKQSPESLYPIAINIFDLDILAYYLSDPFEFIYYVRQRITLNERFESQNEIDLLGFHLNQNLTIKYEDGKEFDVMYVEGMAQLIDAHFPSCRGTQPKTKAMEQLHSKWSNAKFQEIVEILKKSKRAGFTDAIFFLYEMKGKTADNFIENVEKLRARSLQEKKSLGFYMLGKGKKSISYVCDYDSRDFYKSMVSYAQIKKYQTNANMALGLGGIATHAATFEAAIFLNFPWVVDSELEEISQQYYTHSRPVNLKTREKIGRNEPCFCGSGKKFKKCHGGV